MATKATLYLDEKVFRALKVKAALSDRTLSETANALISEGLAADRSREPKEGAVELVFVGRAGIPVLTNLTLPKDYVFNREDVYD